jgi:MFS transporter, Spinster family, sphingosine-1-phosphate transporter
LVLKNARYAWIVVALLWVVWLLNYLDRQVVFSMFPLLKTDLHLTDLQLGLLGTSFLWVYAFASPFSGYAADRYGRKRIIVGSLLVWSAVTWLTGLARNLPELLGTRALMGISEACYLPAGLALIAAYHGPSTRSRATGIHYSGSYLGTVLGGVAGGWFGEHYGWRYVFAALGIVGVVYSAVLAVSLRDRSASVEKGDEAPPPLGAALAELFRLPAFPILVLVFGAVSIGDWMIYTWMPAYLYERFHMSLGEAGFSATFYLRAGAVLGILAGGWLADAWGSRNPRGRIFTQAIGLIAAGPFLFLSGATTSTPFLLAGLAVYGFGKGSYDCNNMPVLCQISRPCLRSTGFGIYNFAGCLAGGGIAAVAGALKSTLGLAGAIQIAGGIVFIAGLVLARTRLGAASGAGDRI